MNNRCVLRVSAITKEFPGMLALDNVSFDLDQGEVHALVGENGAGKSTLMKILSGAYAPTSGTIELGGERFSGFTPKQSAELGISIIYQELSLINELTIAENLFLGRLPYKILAGIKFVDYSSTKPLELKGIINTSSQATYHMAFIHDSTTTDYPLIKQDTNNNFILHWNNVGDKYTFKSNGDAIFQGIISPTTSND